MSVQATWSRKIFALVLSKGSNPRRHSQKYDPPVFRHCVEASEHCSVACTNENQERQYTHAGREQTSYDVAKVLTGPNTSASHSLKSKHSGYGVYVPLTEHMVTSLLLGWVE
jgi:hypothetical protein